VADFSTILMIGLCAARLSWMVSEDEIFSGPRAKLWAWLTEVDENAVGHPGRQFLFRLISCPVWCLPVWFSGGLTLIGARFFDGLPQPGMMWGASAMVATMVGVIVDRLSQ